MAKTLVLLEGIKGRRGLYWAIGVRGWLWETGFDLEKSVKMTRLR